MKYIFLFLFALLFGAGAILYLNKNGFPSLKEIIPISQFQKLPIEREAPELIGIQDWINSEPLTLQGLRGKVVLVDFWTYTCINCIRTFPYLSEWYNKYKDSGFVLLGVHSPEFEFEKKKENVLEAVHKYNLEYPVVLDNNHETWNAFQNRYWPAEYLIDVDGNIRYHHFGEGRYTETERAIQQLLLEGGLLSIDKIAEIRKPPSGVDFRKIGTPEIYLGYLRINNLGNKDENVLPDTPYTFKESQRIDSNRFYFVGTWVITSEFAEFVDEKGKLTIRYKANKVNVVLETRENLEIELEVKLDGKSLTEQNKGADVFFKVGKSFVKVQDSKLYNFVDTGEEYDWHTLEILIPSPGLRVFTFTFG